MLKRSMLKRFTAIAAAVIIVAGLGKPIQARAAEKFDPVFYAAAYADVAAVLGTDAEALYNHYITFGQKEGRRSSLRLIQTAVRLRLDLKCIR